MVTDQETEDRVGAVESVFAQIAVRRRCTDRPWISCSRPDGTPLRQWDRGYIWTDTGSACDP